MPLIDTPAAYAARPLFEPIADLLAGFADGLPDHAGLQHVLGAHAPQARSGGGRPIRFVPPDAAAPAYEVRIHASGEVPTRARDWHDFFNALAWCVWPHAKAACNALHLDEIAAREAAGLAGRGPRRDALTQFDECGVLVVSADAGLLALLALLAAHEWEVVFWQHRQRLRDTTRFLVFGHGSWDQLRHPFFGLCAKTIHRAVGADWLQLPAAAQQAEADAWLAAHLTEALPVLTPRTFSPLPLLGVPGVTPDNAQADYYRDRRQFRPHRLSRPQAG